MRETEESTGPSLALVALAVFTLAVAARLVLLYWSPLPATLDGFRYARLAETTITNGTLPWGAVQADEFVFTLGLAAASLVTGVDPLLLAQPFVAVLGGVVPVVGVALAHRFGLERGWTEREAAIAGLLVGIALALDGILVRRTGVPDEEALGLLLVPLLALAAHRWLRNGRPAWGLTTGGVLVVLPPLHNLSSLVGVLTVWGLACLHAASGRTGRLVRAITTGAVAWVVFVGYFEVAARLGLTLTYSGLLRPYPGLFLAWVVLLGIASAWGRSTGIHTRRLLVGGPIALSLALVAGNALTPLFPGTVQSPPLVVALLLGFVLPVGFAALGAGTARFESGTTPVSLAGYLAPLLLVFYTFSASLTVPFFDAVLRIQSFEHVPILTLGGIGVVAAWRYLDRREISARRALTIGLVVLFVGGILVTLPLGYLNLDTTSYPSTTFQSEYEATGFAAERLEGGFATDHSLSRLTSHSHTPLGPPVLAENGSAVRADIGPTRTWLRGGPPPACPVLSQRSWTSTGAHLYPTPPGTVSPEAYDAFLERRNVVYVADGHDPLVLSIPRTATNETGC